jgi:hypothetical protein
MVNGNSNTVDTLSAFSDYVIAGRTDSQNAYNYIPPIPPTPTYNMRYNTITVKQEEDNTRHFYYRDEETSKKRFVEYIP